MPRHLPYLKSGVPKAKQLRKNLTPAERKLWFDFLRIHSQRWLKQRPIGPYIADFYCASAKLVVELDGDSHFTPEGRAYDLERTAYLEGLGLHVLRFTNLEVLHNLEGVGQAIEQEVRQRTAFLASSEAGSTGVG
ncbi:MAG: endonuclease domain-containing protein [Meiothermus sp.]|nr:endonuclease domain-containing protein [Meiothermus sp.]